jgi:hypothetical protein
MSAYVTPGMLKEAKPVFDMDYTAVLDIIPAFQFPLWNQESKENVSK